MKSIITPQRRKEMEDFIKKHPIDHAYDKECELYDGKVPMEQLLSRDYQEMLDEAEVREEK